MIRNCTFSNLTINTTANGIVFDNPKRYLTKNNSGNADISSICFSKVIMNCQNNPIKISVEKGIKLRRLANLNFSGFTILSRGHCLICGNSETIIRNINFNNINLEISGKDAIISHYCKEIKFTNVEISNY